MSEKPEAFTIRPARLSDAAALAAIYAPYVQNTTVTFEYEAPDVTEFTRRIREIASTYPYLVAEADGKIVGYAYAHRYAVRAAYDWSAETSVYLDPACCGRGVGKALYDALLGLLTVQRVQNVFAIIAIPNEASVGFHRALGFARVGKARQAGYKKDRWLDTETYELALGEHRVPPDPVIPFSALSEETVVFFCKRK